MFFMFCFKYEKRFMFEKEVFKDLQAKSHITHAHFNWSDDTYIDFMMDLMNSLEPINFEKGQLLYDEMEEVLEIYVMIVGEIKIGFRLNHRQSYALKGDDMFFGAYNVTFRKRS
jgi:hypothetical protein